MKRALAVLATVMGCFVAGHASNPPQSQPVATLALSQLLPPGSGAVVTQSVAFVSDTSIAIGICQRWPGTDCILSLIRRDGDVLRSYALASHFRAGMSIHVSSGGQILTTPVGMFPAVLFSSDLSEAQELPSFHLASRSGNTAVEQKGGRWKIYQVLPKLELVREGTSELEAISDSLVVLREGDIISTETLQGKLLGSFSVRPRSKCASIVGLASDDRLYWEDCKGSRMVDLNGKEKLHLHRPKGSGYQPFWSADGKRLLFDHFDRKISILRSTAEDLIAITTLGTGAGDEQDNYEEIKVLDTVSGACCFDWKRTFPEGSEASANDATISPSGEFVAIAAGGTLSIYRVTETCGANK
ncbi:MAG: hypothetical protein ACYDDS_16765 [Candidatus Sulfotelmatobacter sp.]